MPDFLVSFSPASLAPCGSVRPLCATSARSHKLSIYTMQPGELALDETLRKQMYSITSHPVILCRLQLEEQLLEQMLQRARTAEAAFGGGGAAADLQGGDEPAEDEFEDV